jgi:hypothetical protein
MGRKIMQFDAYITFMFILFGFFPFLIKFYKIKFVKTEIEDFFSSIMAQAIEHREKSKIVRDDYLAFLIAMKSKKQLTELDMAAHGVTFFIGEFSYFMKLKYLKFYYNL